MNFCTLSGRQFDVKKLSVAGATMQRTARVIGAENGTRGRYVRVIR